MTDRETYSNAVVSAAIEWAAARRTLLELPDRSPDFRARLNDLSNAEAALREAVEQPVESSFVSNVYCFVDDNGRLLTDDEIRAIPPDTLIKCASFIPAKEAAK